MKAIVNPVALSKELKKMSSIVKKNHIIPITSSVLFSFSKDELTITGTNLDTTYLISMECQSKDIFSFPVDYFDISEICSNCFIPLTIELKENEILFKTDKPYKTKLPRVGETIDFPKMPEDDFVNHKDVNGEFFYHLGNANTCRSKEDLRASLNMVGVIISKTQMDIAGCDAMILYTKKFIEKSDFEKTVMVPDSFVSLCKLFQESKISFGTNYIKAVYGSETVIGRLSESKFADVKVIIPKKIEYNMELEKNELKLSLKEIAVSADITTKQFVINFKKDKIDLVSQDIDFAKSSETSISTNHSVGIDQICFNSSQLLHLASITDTDEMLFSITAQNKTAVIQPKGDDSILMLLFPLMITNN